MHNVPGIVKEKADANSRVALASAEWVIERCLYNDAICVLKQSYSTFVIKENCSLRIAGITRDR